MKVSTNMKVVGLTALLLTLLTTAVVVYQAAAPEPRLSESERLAQVIAQYESTVSDLEEQVQ